MKRIPLSQGKVALVDDADYEALSKFKWYATKNHGTFYAYRREPNKKDGKTVYMHREVLDAPKGLIADHINGDGLDNQRKNLRLVTPRENQWNRRTHREGQLLGATKYHNGRWLAQTQVDGKKIHIGYFSTELEAHNAFIAFIR